MMGLIPSQKSEETQVPALSVHTPRKAVHVQKQPEGPGQEPNRAGTLIGVPASRIARRECLLFKSLRRSLLSA